MGVLAVVFVGVFAGILALVRATVRELFFDATWAVEAVLRAVVLRAVVLRVEDLRVGGLRVAVLRAAVVRADFALELLRGDVFRPLVDSRERGEAVEQRAMATPWWR